MTSQEEGAESGSRTRLEEALERESSGKEFWNLRLYVAGESPKSLQAYVNLKQICETHLGHRYEIEIVDLLVDPGRAREDEIVAIPTLVRQRPAPIRKLIGDLSDTERVLTGLHLRIRH